jgi:hypothetical protein
MSGFLVLIEWFVYIWIGMVILILISCALGKCKKGDGMYGGVGNLFVRGSVGPELGVKRD